MPLVFLYVLFSLALSPAPALADTNRAQHGLAGCDASALARLARNAEALQKHSIQSPHTLILAHPVSELSHKLNEKLELIMLRADFYSFTEKHPRFVIKFAEYELEPSVILRRQFLIKNPKSLQTFGAHWTSVYLVFPNSVIYQTPDVRVYDHDRNELMSIPITHIYPALEKYYKPTREPNNDLHAINTFKIFQNTLSQQQYLNRIGSQIVQASSCLNSTTE